MLPVHKRRTVPRVRTRKFRDRHPVAAKVPEITIVFWIIKVLTTGMGESMSDFMGQHSVPIAGAVGILGLAFALWLQMRTLNIARRSTGSR